jgi:hypothetical protein
MVKRSTWVLFKFKTLSCGLCQSYQSQPIDICSFIFFAYPFRCPPLQTKKTSVVWSTPHHYRKGTRVIWSSGLRCAPQSCRDFKNSRSLCPKGVLKQLKILNRHLFRCSPNANGKLYLALKRPTNIEPYGLDYIFYHVIGDTHHILFVKLRRFHQEMHTGEQP